MVARWCRVIRLLLHSPFLSKQDEDKEESDEEEKKAILAEENLLQLEEAKKVGRCTVVSLV